MATKEEVKRITCTNHCLKSNENFTRDGGLFNAQVLIDPNGVIGYNGEEELTSWMKKILEEAGIEQKVATLAL